MTQQMSLSGTDAKRAAAENVVRRYPEVSPEELGQVLHYLRKEAAILDRAAIAANSELEGQYRRLCHDHYLSRPHPGTLLAIGGAVLLLAAILIWQLA